MIVVPPYAAILALIFVMLSVRVISFRRKRRIAIGTNGDRLLERAMRVQANFAEYVPLTLLLLFLLETKSFNDVWLHILCMALTIGRISHAWGVSQEKEDYRFRMLGMMLTFGTIVCAAGTLLYLSAI